MVLRHVSFVSLCCIFKNSPAVAWVPSLAADKVASVSPAHLVTAALEHGVGSLAATIGPPRVKVAVVGAFTVGGDLAPLESLGRVAVVLVEKVERTTKSRGHGRGGKEERLERNHDGTCSVVVD